MKKRTKLFFGFLLSLLIIFLFAMSALIGNKSLEETKISPTSEEYECVVDSQCEGRMFCFKGRCFGVTEEMIRTCMEIAKSDWGFSKKVVCEVNGFQPTKINCECEELITVTKEVINQKNNSYEIIEPERCETKRINFVIPIIDNYSEYLKG